MSDYQLYEQSVESGSPVELYSVFIGAEGFHYTSGENTVLLGATEYSPVAGLKRSKLEDGAEKRNVDFSVDLPTDDELAQRFLQILPGRRVPLTVRRYHRGDTGGGGPEAITIFQGFILSAKFTKKARLCTLTARSALASLGRIIPARSYMSSCNNVLYDPTTCRADDTDPANRFSAAAVSSQVGNLLTVPGLTVFPDGALNSGYVEAIGSSDVRLIIDHVGDVVELMTPFNTQPATVNVFRGCRHTIEACHDDFDNVLNFDGFAFVPLRNPFTAGVV